MAFFVFLDKRAGVGVVEVDLAVGAAGEDLEGG